MSKVLFDSWYTEPCGELVPGSPQPPRRHSSFFEQCQAPPYRTIIGWGGLVIIGDALPRPITLLGLLVQYMDQIWRNSCGKCVPCRVGTGVIHQRLLALARGLATVSDFDEILAMGEEIRNSCKCAYGTAFQKPIRDVLTYFRGEIQGALEAEEQCELPPVRWFMTAPCNHGCPANTDAARYIELITEQKLLAGNAVAYNPDAFAGCMGRACFHPCETACKRKDVDQPIAISALKRAVTDFALRAEREQGCQEACHQSTGCNGKVAIIGAGAAGTHCAIDLAEWDYDVTIFEASSVVGGIAYLGIPEYRLPRDIVEREVARAQRRGVKLRLNAKLGVDFTVQDLEQQGFEAILLAIGCMKGKQMGIADEDTYAGVWDAIDFLREMNIGARTKLGETVIVVGGGNTAVDAVRICRHIGYSKVIMAYRRTKLEMPASKWEVDEAVAEGVEIMELTAPVKVLGKDGKVTGLVLQRMELGEPDSSGRRRPVPVEGSDFTVATDLIIAAVSQSTELDYFRSIPGLQLTKWETFTVNDDTMQTTVPSIFAGGDVATGPMSIIDACATGRKAAVGIDKYLASKRGLTQGTRSHDSFETMLFFRKIISALGVETPQELNADIPQRSRQPMPHLPPHDRIGNFEEVDLGYQYQQALLEAARCMRCYRIIMTA